MEQLVFYLFATVAVLSALVVVSQSNAVYSALALIVCFGSLAILFFQLGAYFIAAIQVIVYAGAIMILFLFAVMLVDPESEIFSRNQLGRVRLVGLPMAVVLGFLLLGLVAAPYQAPAGSDSPAWGDVEVIGESLFREYLLPFELTSILILVAILGTMVLAKRAS